MDDQHMTVEEYRALVSSHEDSALDPRLWRPKPANFKPEASSLLLVTQLTDTLFDLIGTHQPSIFTEWMFAYPQRQWRVDVAIPTERLMIEVEGGAYTEGRHTRGGGFIDDMRKYNAMTLGRLHLLRYTPDWVDDGRACREIVQVLKGWKKL